MSASEIASQHGERTALEAEYEHLIQTNGDLSRQLVSFQGNKETRFSRWFKYKEGFSEQMVSYLLLNLGKKPGRLLDPFAGAGAALFAGRNLGWNTTGIELLPVGVFVMQSRLAAESVVTARFREIVETMTNSLRKPLLDSPPRFEHVNITRGAFPKNTEDELNAYLAFCESANLDPSVKTLLKMAALAVLESVSYTRKDGQYLRWDSRSGRRCGSRGFDKGPILAFETAIMRQLRLMLDDLTVIPGDLFASDGDPFTKRPRQDMTIIHGSCLTKIPQLSSSQFDFILTSPPYCNRYDYTRTYALELMLLGAGEAEIKQLRQALLSCTVENLPKVQELESFYGSNGRYSLFRKAADAFAHQRALQEVLGVLEMLRLERKLNNDNVVRMIRNYFLEMSLVIHECARVLKPGGWFVMVNDNVSYAGEIVPVDLILSEFAKSAGLTVDRIWKLSRGKGNSSQQMGAHGRNELRKCVYVWRSPIGKRAT